MQAAPVLKGYDTILTVNHFVSFFEKMLGKDELATALLNFLLLLASRIQRNPFSIKSYFMLEDAKTNMEKLSHDGSNNNHRVFSFFF